MWTRGEEEQWKPQIPDEVSWREIGHRDAQTLIALVWLRHYWGTIQIEHEDAQKTAQTLSADASTSEMQMRHQKRKNMQSLCPSVEDFVKAPPSRRS